MSTQDLSSRLKELRKEKGWTQQDLATKSGLAFPTICAIETGQRKGYRDDTLESLAEALEVSPSYLKYGEIQQTQGYSINVPALYSPAERKLVEDFLSFLDYRRYRLEQSETNKIKFELKQVTQFIDEISNLETKQATSDNITLPAELLLTFCLGKYMREWNRIYFLYLSEIEGHILDLDTLSNFNALKNNPLHSFEDLEYLIELQAGSPI